jgi:hypothetical protein
MEKVKSVTYNWHQPGSVNDRDGAGDNWERFTVGEKGVNFIRENIPKNSTELWNYEIYVDHKYTYRIFNPNFVEYF